MNPYDALFADQDLADVVLEAEFPAGSKLDVARARMWEGKPQETASLASGAGEPWASFVVGLAQMNAGQSPTRIKGVAEDAFQEARARAWAWTALRKLGEKPAPMYQQEVLGVVVEVPVDDGLDVLAAYTDGSVRFLGHADQLIVREADGKPDAKVAALVSQAHALLASPPAPRDKAAPPPPPEAVRFTALSANGLHRVEVPWKEVEKGGKYEPLFAAAVDLLREVTTA
jgi:hypothetical protein